jgi:hypothetical protein
MISRKESLRFRERLESQTPLPSEADTDRLREEVHEYVREAQRRAPSKSGEMVSTVLDRVARDYFRRHLQKKTRRTRRSVDLLRGD